MIVYIASDHAGYFLKEFVKKFLEKSGFLVKVLRSTMTTMGEINGELLFKDYKDIDGIMVAVTQVQRAAQQEVIMKLDVVKSNIKMPKDRFTPPADVKPLLAPAKKAA